ncbi:MAG: SAM-dependent methyltransferase [Cytophaga sp.]|nr:SAM-dependent methyltransferase [Cytophaga sp.]
MSPFHLIKAAASHWLHVVDEHSIHSPFFYDFYINVFKKKSAHPMFTEIERTRRRLLNNSLEIEVKDLGSGSVHFNHSKRVLSKIAATSLAPADLCELYYRILQFQEAKTAVELGTSLGITSLYLAAKPDVHVTTFEGSPAIADIALTNFESFNSRNIHLVEGNIDATLPDYLQNPAKVNFALVDANHRYEPTLRYFHLLSKRMSKKGIMIIDDIYHSQEMTRAWNELKSHELVYGSVDLFRCGILFFDVDLNKQHFVWSL